MGVFFSDNFPGSELNPEKWNNTAVGSTVYSVTGNKLTISSCNEDTWFGDNVTQHGNQIRAIIELSTEYVIRFTIRAVNNVDGGLGVNQVALIKENGDIVVGIGYMDYEAGATQTRRFCKAENNFSYKNPSWDQETSEDQILKPVSSDDSMDVTIQKVGSTITISDGDGVIGTVNITNTPVYMAVLTGRYASYPFFGTIELSDLSVSDDTLPSEAVRVRAKVKVMEGMVKRVRARIWIMPDRRVFVRSKIKIVEQINKLIRAKVKVREANPQKRLAKIRVRGKLEIIPLYRVFVRAKVKVDNDDTSIELFARVTMRDEDYNSSSNEFEFIVGDTRYDS